MSAPIVIAFAGKGGTGKTTVSGILVRYLVSLGKKVLAVDADPNSNLNEVLGVDLPVTLGDVRESLAGREKSGEPIPGGMSKAAYAEFVMGDCLSEEDNYDLLVMGRTQGQGCYCFVNGLLKTQIERYAKSYDYIIVDNEAGLEHISRGTLPRIDILLLVSDCSRRGIQAVGRLSQMAKDLRLEPKREGLIVNMAPQGGLAQGILDEVAAQGLNLAAVLPRDEEVYEADAEGKPSSELPETSAIKSAMGQLYAFLLS
ncbi:MAG: AAA family ATPase [Oscillospiraceae bacterium]|jgi:CO dehydrogenase maturation factor|nr:AAA family ATPase [Oscillospiraceae bacterium]